MDRRHKRWDVFISYASEDRQAVVAPLVDCLTRAGIRIWVDYERLRVGDSLRAAIDAGLTQASFGVVILSRNYLKKCWPLQELNAFISLEDDKRVILPVWHDLDKSDVTQTSPIMADRVAANTRDGIPAVAKAIVDAIYAPPRGILGGRPDIGSPTITRSLVELLSTGPDPSTIRDFVAFHPEILPGALGISSFGAGVLCDVRLGEWTVPLVAMFGAAAATDHYITFEKRPEHTRCVTSQKIG